MNKDKKRIAIAEACGWTDIRNDKSTFEQYQPSLGLVGVLSSGVERQIPDYLNDLNAMHEAEKVDELDWEEYHQQVLERVRGAGSQKRDISTLHATASQRAEAFLKTLNLWDES